MGDDDRQHDDQPLSEPAPTGIKWGDPIDEARKQELWQRLRAWSEGADHGDKKGPFDDETLTGAEVFWLSVGAVAGPGDDAAAQNLAELQLRSAANDSEDPYMIDLSPLTLQGAVLGRAQLQKAYLVNVHLEGANLGSAHLQEAHIFEAQLQGAYLVDAELQETDLGYAHLERANLSGAQLQEANLSGAHLQGASLFNARLERANLFSAQLKEAYLSGAHLQRAILSRAHLQEAHLFEAQLQQASLFGAQLQGSDLHKAQLKEAILGEAQLERANLESANLEGADLRRTSLDKQTQVDHAILTDVRLAGVIFDNTDLSVVDWSLVPVLKDERIARQRRYEDEENKVSGKRIRGKRKDRATRKSEYQAAVRAYRRLAVALQANGLNEEASEYTYRAQVMQRRAYWYGNAYGRWSFSALLAVLAGYGYRLGRILLAYAIILLTFALAYYLTGLLVPGSGKPLAWYEALLVSFTAVHGRVFIGQFGLDSVYSWIAGIGAVMGIVIEGVFVAMLIQRFFSR